MAADGTARLFQNANERIDAYVDKFIFNYAREERWDLLEQGAGRLKQVLQVEVRELLKKNTGLTDQYENAVAKLAHETRCFQASLESAEQQAEESSKQALHWKQKSVQWKNKTKETIDVFEKHIVKIKVDKEVAFVRPAVVCCSDRVFFRTGPQVQMAGGAVPSAPGYAS